MTETLPSRKGTVLIVEDDPVSMEVLTRPLERIGGYTVEPLTCGEEALERMKSNGVDLLIVDIQLPNGISGLTMIRRLRDSGCGTPVLLVSAALTEDDERIARGVPFCRVAQKPIPPADLVETVEAMIDRYHVVGSLTGIQATLLSMRTDIAKLREELGPSGSKWMNGVKFATMFGYRFLVAAFLSVSGVLLAKYPKLLAVLEKALEEGLRVNGG